MIQLSSLGYEAVSKLAANFLSTINIIENNLLEDNNYIVHASLEFLCNFFISYLQFFFLYLSYFFL